MHLDIARAYFDANASRDIYAKLLRTRSQARRRCAVTSSIPCMACDAQRRLGRESAPRLLGNLGS